MEALENRRIISEDYFLFLEVSLKLLKTIIICEALQFLQREIFVKYERLWKWKIKNSKKTEIHDILDNLKKNPKKKFQEKKSMSWNYFKNNHNFFKVIKVVIPWISINSISPIFSQLQLSYSFYFCRVIVGKLIYALLKNFCATGEV